jgi:signal transduction histidine kinase
MADSTLTGEPADSATIHRERLAALGTLAAGLAHELNNPAIAIGRSVDLLRENIEQVDPILRQIASHSWTEGELRFLARLGATTEGARDAVAALDIVDRTDREEALIDWLDAHKVRSSPELAAALVDRGVTPDELATLANGCSADIVTDALAWLARLTLIRQLLDDVGRSAARIAELVRAVKSQAYVDAARRVVDIHESLESSLTLMGYKLREARARVVRSYDRSLPRLETYGTELHQLWTNLFDNAADALASKSGDDRTITVQTAKDSDGIRIDVADTGPGIPDAISTRIFDAHVTTKEAGKGTGLGLDIVRRIVEHHHGSISCESSSAGARFVVRLPLAQPAGTSDGGTTTR